MTAADSLLRMAWAQTWQVTLLIAIVAVLTRLAARNRPHLAYALWLVVLIKCVTPPLLSSPGGLFCWLQPRTAVESSRPIERPALENTITWSTTPEVQFDATRADDPSQQTERLSEVSPPDVESPGVAVDRWGPVKLALLVAWGVGGLAVAVAMAVRWTVCLRRIFRATISADPAHAALLTELARRLELRRQPKLIVTARAVGPAVIGLWRPTVILPEAVTLIEGRISSEPGRPTGSPAFSEKPGINGFTSSAKINNASREALEPILAHELIHLRRGDLWAGVLQMVVQAVWWFHPLAWWACRQASREAERCCDEAVVAELGSPGRYARSLLDVLRQKRTFFPFPTVPGVRSVEVTSIRLERIMSLGQGSRKRGPWWCWMAMAALSTVALPGGALVAQSDPPNPPVSVYETKPAEPGRAAGIVLDANRNASAAKPSETNRPKVDSVKSALPSSKDANVKQILIHASVIELPTELLGELGVKWDVMFPQPGPPVAPRPPVRPTPLPAPVAKTPYRHAREAVLDSPGDAPADSTGGESSAKAPVLTGRASVRTVSVFPVVCKTLDEDLAKTVLVRARKAGKSHVLTQPIICTASGLEASFLVGTTMPYFAGVKNGKAFYQMIDVGIQVAVLPVVRDGDTVLLSYRMTQTDLVAATDKNAAPVDLPTVRITSGDSELTADKLSVGLPAVTTREVECEASLTRDQWLLACIPDSSRRDGKPRSTIVVLHAELVKPGQERPLPATDRDVPMAAPVPGKHSSGK